MQRGERFALGAGLAGLAADLGIVLFFFLPGSPTPRFPPSVPATAAVVGVMTYGWVLVAWVLTRRALNRARRRHRPSTHARLARAELSQNTLWTVLGMGLLLVPLQFAVLGTRFPRSDPMFRMVDRETDIMEWTISIGFMSVVSVAVLGAAVYYTIILLMPVIYRDVRAR